MKKLTLLLLILSGFSAKAQQLSFEETVNYINNIFSKINSPNYFEGDSKEGRRLAGIKADKSGRVSICSAKSTENDEYIITIGYFNVFELDSAIVSNDYLILRDKDNYRLGMFARLTPDFGRKLGKAFKHLSTLCTKEEDPFD